MLKLNQVTCGYHGHPIVKDISFEVAPGEVVCILGVNGVGKTTLFKTILAHIPILGGSITLEDNDLSKISCRKLAQKIGYVPQVHAPPFPYQVTDVVMTGRTAHLPLFSSPSRKDEEIGMKMLEELNISHLADKVYTEISGGERQLVLIARALVQQPRILIMDEPTSNLDFGNQMRTLQVIRRLADSGYAVVLTTHNPDHALQCATKAVVLYHGSRYAVGAPGELITGDMIKEVYGIEAEVKRFEKENSHTEICIPWL